MRLLKNMYNGLRGVGMGFYNKLKSKVFPDEKEVLYYSNDEQINKDNESRTYTTNVNNTFYSPSSFAQTRILSDKLKAGNVITIDVSNMEKKEALRKIDRFFRWSYVCFRWGYEENK